MYYLHPPLAFCQLQETDQVALLECRYTLGIAAYPQGPLAFSWVIFGCVYVRLYTCDWCLCAGTVELPEVTHHGTEPFQVSYFL